MPESRPARRPASMGGSGTGGISTWGDPEFARLDFAGALPLYPMAADARPAA